MEGVKYEKDDKLLQFPTIFQYLCNSYISIQSVANILQFKKEYGENRFKNKYKKCVYCNDQYFRNRVDARQKVYVK